MFGTDGIRGRVGEDPLTLETVLALARAVGRLLVEEPDRLGLTVGGPRRRVLIGRDTRRSGPMIERIVVAGLEAAGVEVTIGGVLPTPAVAYLAATEGHHLGIVVSASHNPHHDNGIKFFDAAGRKLSASAEEAIGAAAGLEAGPLAADLGTAIVDDDAARRYFQAMLDDPAIEVDLEGFRIVIDCAHGAVGAVLAPNVLFNLGIEATFLFNDPDGTNINRGCGATDPSALREAVVRTGADLGMSFDGDGDRVVLADEEGGLVDGDAMLAILALDRAARGDLATPIVVGTVMSNFGLERCLAEAGVELERTPVGDKHVAARMAETGSLFGGEPSGHLLFGDHDHVLTGDGLYTALRVLSVVARTGSSLQQLASVCQPVPQVLRAVGVDRKVPFDEMPAIGRELDRARAELGDGGRVLLRYSGTEPVARVMVEGIDAAQVESLADRLAAVVDQELGAARALR